MQHAKPFVYGPSSNDAKLTLCETLACIGLYTSFQRRKGPDLPKLRVAGCDAGGSPAAWPHPLHLFRLGRSSFGSPVSRVIPLGPVCGAGIDGVIPRTAQPAEREAIALVLPVVPVGIALGTCAADPFMGDVSLRTTPSAFLAVLRRRFSPHSEHVQPFQRWPPRSRHKIRIPKRLHPSFPPRNRLLFAGVAQMTLFETLRRPEK
jgi:hypothetical protein